MIFIYCIFTIFIKTSCKTAYVFKAKVFTQNTIFYITFHEDTHSFFNINRVINVTLFFFTGPERTKYDYATEQQCKENLRNSTSGQGNPSESVQVYHTVSKDLKGGSEKSEKYLCTVSDSMYTQIDLRFKDFLKMSSSENQRCISYEEICIQSLSPEKSLSPETHERVLSVVYYALEKKEELNLTASLNDTTTELYVNAARHGK